MIGDQQIERRAAALASGGAVGLDELDVALTDVAAEVLALRTELLRVNHRLAAVLNDGDRDLETLDRARGLAGRRSELNTRWERLSGLLGELRARRDRGCRRVMDRCGSGSRSWAPPRARGYRGEGGTP